LSGKEEALRCQDLREAAGCCATGFWDCIARRGGADGADALMDGLVRFVVTRRG
jgi:hypothetical protein